MCSIDNTKHCDNCLEVVVETDSGFTLEFTYDPRDKDNDILRTWLFATGFVDGVLVRGVGDTVWSSMTKEEWQIGQA
jgi:hypothetical protein